MEKVKVTPELARAIEDAKHHFNLGAFVSFLNDQKGFGSNYSKALAREYLPHDKPVLLQAMIYGYEVEPEFKVDNHIVTKGGIVCQIARVYPNNEYHVSYFKNKELQSITIDINVIDRHATKQEVWWAKHGRKPWELMRGDTLSREYYSSYTVWETDEDGVKFNEFGIFKKWNELKEEFKVSCFAQDRKDI